MKPFTFESAKNVEDAVLLKKSNKKFIAGGTNLVDHLKKNIEQPDFVIDITKAVPNSVSREDNKIIIGAMVTNTELANNLNLLNNFPIISKAVLAGASPQIRNMASTAGNILQRTRCPYFYDLDTPCNKRKPGSGCSAISGDQKMAAIIGYSNDCIAVHPSDLCIALAVLDTTIIAENTKKETIKIPFNDFHKLPKNTPWFDTTLPENSLVTAIEIQKNAFFNKNFAYTKVRERTSYAFAMISCAALLNIQNGKIMEARLASGGVAHKPWRWFEAEEYLKGKTPSTDVFTKAANIAIEKVKPFEDNKYKVPMLKGAIETALKEAIS